MTLGVVLTLGGVTGGRGQELSDSVIAASSPRRHGAVRPADAARELVRSAVHADGFADHDLQLEHKCDPDRLRPPPGVVLGDFTSTTNLGFSTKANVYGQQLYFDTTFGVIRYLHQANLIRTYIR